MKEACQLKVVKTLVIVLGILTIAGGIYVFSTGGRANAGYAVIPMAFCLVLLALVRKKLKG
jgi:hypothetical protein